MKILNLIKDAFSFRRHQKGFWLEITEDGMSANAWPLSDISEIGSVKMYKSEWKGWLHIALTFTKEKKE